MADRRGARVVAQRTFEVEPAAESPAPPAPSVPPAAEPASPAPSAPARPAGPFRPSDEGLWARRYRWLDARAAAERAAADPPPPS